MKSIQEVEQFILDNVKIESQDFNIEITENNWNGQRLNVTLPEWTSKNLLMNSDEIYWLVKRGLESLDRRYNKDSKEIVITGHDRASSSIRNGIADYLTTIILKTTPAAAPKRTKVYKQLMDMYHKHKREDSFLNDALPIIDYYRNSLTEDEASRKVHNKNIHSLLLILGRKYGSRSIG